MTTGSATPPPGRGPGDRARLSAALREARRRVGLAGVETGQRAGMSQSKISKIERGYLLPSVEDVAALCRVYGVTNQERDELLALVDGLRAESSSKVILARGVAEFQRRIGQLEASASLIRAYEPAMVIGLLQTPAYARCVFSVPDSQELSAEAVEDAVAARAGRQLALDDESTKFVLIMSEGALRWQACSAEVMAEQVDAIGAASRSNVAIGLIPWTTPVRFFPRHGFHLYDEDAAMVGTETATATMTGAADIATYVELFTALEGLALFGDAAREHLTRIANDYRQLAT
jgi:transcriptional regulator with XRE-family HTH domain